MASQGIKDGNSFTSIASSICAIEIGGSSTPLESQMESPIKPPIDSPIQNNESKTPTPRIGQVIKKSHS